MKFLMVLSFVFSTSCTIYSFSFTNGGLCGPCIPEKSYTITSVGTIIQRPAGVRCARWCSFALTFLILNQNASELFVDNQTTSFDRFGHGSVSTVRAFNTSSDFTVLSALKDSRNVGISVGGVVLMSVKSPCEDCSNSPYKGICTHVSNNSLMWTFKFNNDCTPVLTLKPEVPFGPCNVPSPC